MAEYDDLYCLQQLIDPVDPISSMVIIRESPILAKDDRVVFPPVNHENLHVASSICGFDRYLESSSGSESRSSSSRSSSSFSSFPSDSDGQPPVTACQLDRKSPSETEEKSPPSPGGESPPYDSGGHSPLTACGDRKSPLPDSVGKPPRKSLYHEANIFPDWWELLLVRVYSKLKNLLLWFSTTLRPYYPVLAIAIWWWMRVRARRRRIKRENTARLRDVIKEKDERIIQLLHQIAQMNELLVKHHKEII